MTRDPQKRLLGLALERDHERRARVAGAHHEQVHDRLDAAQHDGRLAPVDLGLHARLADQRHERLADLPKLAAAPVDIARDLALGDLRAMLLDEPLPARLAVWRCLRGASRSAFSHSSMICRYAPNAGAGRPSGDRFSGGTADSSACRTARRCTRCRLANSRIDNPSRA